MYIIAKQIVNINLSIVKIILIKRHTRNSIHNKYLFMISYSFNVEYKFAMPIGKCCL